MGKIEHLQFLVLLIPTFVILGAAAVSQWQGHIAGCSS